MVTNKVEPTFVRCTVSSDDSFAFGSLVAGISAMKPTGHFMLALLSVRINFYGFKPVSAVAVLL